MSDRNRQERAAIETVARRFAATWERRGDPPRDSLTVAGKRVPIEVAVLGPTDAGRGKAANPRLRFDKVATRLMERLQAAVRDEVPAGVTVLVTVTAPIRLASKTAAFLEERTRTLLGRRSHGRDETATIHGNRVRIRVLKGQSNRVPKLIGFVHNPDTDPLLLMNMTRGWLELSDDMASRRAPRAAGDRWLVVVSARESSCFEAYRDIVSQMRGSPDFKKILIVFDDGRVGMLKG